MEGLLEEHEKLSEKCNLSKSVEDVQKTIDLLVKARDSIIASMFLWFLSGRSVRSMLIRNLKTRIALR